MALPGLLDQQEEDNPLTMPNVGAESTRQTTEALGGGGAAAAPGLALQVVQPPEEVRRSETTGAQQTITQKVVHPEIEKAEAKIDDALAAKERAAVKEQEAKTRISEVETRAAMEKADRMRLAVLEKEQAEREDQKRVEVAVSEQEKSRQALAEAEAGKKRGYWDDKSSGERVLKAFLVGLSTYAHVRGGGQGPGPAYQVLQDEIAHDRQLKLDKLDAAEKAYARSGQVVAGLDEALARRRKRIDDEAVANMNWAESAWGAVAKGLGTPVAKAAFEQAQADLNIQRQKDREQLYKDKDTEIRTAGERHDYSRTVNINKPPPGANAKPTEGEAKFAMYSAQMKDALGVIGGAKPLSQGTLEELQNQSAMFDATEKTASSGVGGALVSRAGRGLGLLPKSPVEGMKPEEQKVVNAADNIVNAMLRTESGAAIGQEELRRRVHQTLPVAGDSEALRQQKLQQLHRMATDYGVLGGVATQRIEAGRAGAAAPTAPAAKPAPAPKPANRAVEDGRAIRDMSAWLKAHPKDKDAAEVRGLLDTAMKRAGRR